MLIYENVSECVSDILDLNNIRRNKNEKEF